MISIKKDATNVIALDVAVSKDYLLLQFVNMYKQAQRITICAPVVESGINTVTIIEQSGTINALNGEVYLSSLGDWRLNVYQQDSSSNLSPENAEFLGQFAVNVFSTDCLSEDPCQPIVITEIDGGDAQGDFETINGLLDGCGA
jgi:hypothetical protein